MTEDGIPITPDLKELIDKACEELRPLVSEIVNKAIISNKELVVETSSIIETPPAEQFSPSMEVVETPTNPEIAEISINIKEILAKVQDFTYKDDINKQLHEELQKHQSGLRREFITPLLKFVIREYDRVIQQHEFYRRKNEEEPQGEIFTKLLKEFNIVSLSLLDLLDDYGIVPVEVQIGDNYSPAEHKILKVIDTNDEAQNGKIAECIICGFRDMETGRLLRQSEISIFKLKQ